MIEPSLIDEERVAVVVADDDRRYVHANAAACELLGISHDELIGMRVEEITGTPPGQVEEVWARFRNNGVFVGTFPLPSPVGPRNVPYISVADVAPGRHMASVHPRRATEATGSRSASASARSWRSWRAARPAARSASGSPSPRRRSRPTSATRCAGSAPATARIS